MTGPRPAGPRTLLPCSCSSPRWPVTASATDCGGPASSGSPWSRTGPCDDEAGGKVRDGDARPEVAWGTSDLFTQAAPAGRFFGLLTKTDGLRWFQSPAAGYDAPVFARLAARGVRVTNAHVNSLPIAEFVMRAVLDEFQRAAEWRRLAAARAWLIHDWQEVSGSTWLVVGLGGIGGAVAVRARAFGAHVIGCRRTPSPGTRPI